MPSALWFCMLEAAHGSRKLYALSHVWPARANLAQLTDFDLQYFLPKQQCPSNLPVGEILLQSFSPIQI